MNERVKELIEQATTRQVVSGSDVFTTPPVYFDKEKFAELIVRGCIDQAHGVADLRGTNDDMIYGADTAAVRIAKHFGVK